MVTRSSYGNRRAMALRHSCSGKMKRIRWLHEKGFRLDEKNLLRGCSWRSPEGVEVDEESRGLG